MEVRDLLGQGPYSVSQEEKERLYRGFLAALTAKHRSGCAAYGNFLDTLNFQEGPEVPVKQYPFLPVSVFKERELKSVPEEEVFKTITSSGTSAQKVSRILLDADTSRNQQMALYHIVSDFIGPKRVPYMVLDTRKVLKDRRLFSARGAGILGFSIFASETCYALDENMQLDLKGVEAFLEKHAGERILLFGFTFMVWKYFVQALREAGKKLSIPGGFLIHGGGWKKLSGIAVSPEEFAAGLLETAGIREVSNYYGMAEQTGGIYMECLCGHLHASVWSEILFRRPSDWGECGIGEEGVIEVISPIAGSYPGHILLTEDLGTLLGTDDCPCGRKGKYFKIRGRIPRAEVRGCSDTFEGQGA